MNFPQKIARNPIKLFFVKVLCLLIPLFFISGCLTWNHTDLTVKLKPDKSGKFDITIGPLGSDSSQDRGRVLDLMSYIYEIKGTSDFFGTKSEIKSFRLYEKDGALKLRVKGVFDAGGGLEEVSDIKWVEERFVKPIEKGLVVSSTNGEVVLKDNATYIFWPENSKALTYSTKSAPLAFEGRWKNEFSILKEYKAFIKEPAPFITIFVEEKIKDAYGALEKGDYKKAREYFSLVLRVQPESEIAAREIEKIKDL